MATASDGCVTDEVREGGDGVERWEGKRTPAVVELEAKIAALEKELGR